MAEIVHLPVRTKDCRHGRFTYLVNDLFVGRSLELYGEFSEGEAQLFAQLLKPGAVVVEAGANIGALTVPVARAVGAAGRVIAYEPQWALAEMLRRNLLANAIATVEVRAAALGAAPDTLMVPIVDYGQTGNFGGVALGQQGARAVPVETIDGLALRRLDLLKIDVEGMECAVLAGAADTLQRLRPVLYVENDRRDNSTRLISQIIEAGYRLWWDIVPLFNPNNYFGRAENVFADGLSINMLGVPAERPAAIAATPVTGPEDTWRAALARMRGTA